MRPGARAARAAVIALLVVVATVVGGAGLSVFDRFDQGSPLRVGGDRVELSRGLHTSGPSNRAAGVLASCSTAALPTDLLGTELAMPVWETVPAGPVDGRFQSSVVWTGREVIVWGGEQGGDGPTQSTGAAYDPVAGAWRRIADARIAPRSAHVAVWTGTEMAIWGGGEGGHHPGDAGAYDPATDSWRVIPPSPIRSVGSATGVWNGSEVLIWGGFLEGIFPVVDGGAFDPCANTSRELPAFPLAEGRRSPLAVWTGTEAIIWGGTRTNNVPWEDGAAFNPATGQWHVLPPVDIFGFFEPTGGWTGSELIIWGWSNLVSGRAEHNQTVAFDPVANTWRHLAPAPFVPVAHEVEGTGASAAALWAGNRLLVWTRQSRRRGTARRVVGAELQSLDAPPAPTRGRALSDLGTGLDRRRAVPTRRWT